MSLVLIESEELEKIIAKHVEPLRDEIGRLTILIESESKEVSLKEFAKRSGRSEGTIRLMLESGKIKFSQAGQGCKITIPVSELNKIKQ